VNFTINALKLQTKQGNRRYQTSPALCNTTAPFAADRPHRMRPEIFRILFALAWHTEYMISSAACRYWRLNDPFCSERGSDVVATAAAKIAKAFEWPAQQPKIAPFLLGYLHPHLIHGSLGSRLYPKLHLDRFSRFCMGPKCYAVQCIVNGEETPKIVPSHLDFVIPSEEDRATTIGNVHEKFGIDRAFGRYPRGQTHRQTNIHRHRRTRYNTSPSLPRVQ